MHKDLNNMDMERLLSMDLDTVPEMHDARARDEVLESLHQMIDEDAILRGRGRRKLWPGIFLSAVAAAACTFLGIFLYNLNKEAASVKWIKAESCFGQKKTVALPDGSEIFLHNESYIIYPAEFQDNLRNIFAEGEVFASIVPDKNRPFILSTQGANVKVKGTKFNFRTTPENSEVEVMLVEGIVDLELSSGTVEKILPMKKGDIIKANLETGIITSMKFDPDKYVSWKDMKVLYFNDETFENIVNKLTKEFGVKIIVEKKALLKVRYFASFVNDETPMQILKTLNTDGEMKITQSGDTIYIK